ncbi:DUF4145 domain-containing protein [Brucella anthropi]|uniref:DUF4145 domain-containing protein n=1 Tax=Brucella anthropi TaxID=529 RepID=A0A6L3YYE6_BRUAN|nr:DUF4145 domain-containing protein [Brucella anthropi]KAB2758248.1 DUF4145 domain-containing protein [Brucella anthropi]UVV66686.1 DUF4145 domain-containing protein [Brucella anthropi]
MNWECAYCGHKQISSQANFTADTIELLIGETADGRLGITYVALRCLNKKCNQLSLSVSVSGLETAEGANYPRLVFPFKNQWRLLPASGAKAQPDYIPAAIREDYYEACKIKNDSPKASATLARRCLQGMIRDFCKISKNRLIDEIAELESQLEQGTAPRGVDDETIAAITAVRKLGNIGAHMEKDINIIVDVDPDEAQTLIELIEMLFADWYVARHKRQQRLAAIQEITASKEEQKKLSGTAPASANGNAP